MSLSTEFTLPETPMATPPLFDHPYGHPINIRRVIINSTPNTTPKSILISRERIVVKQFGHNKEIEIYRGDGMETLKIYEKCDSDHSSTNEEESEELLASITEFPLFEGEVFELYEIFVYGDCSVVLYGDAICQ